MMFLRKLHKWLSLAIGIQVLLWLLSGLMLSSLDANKVSGKQWAREANIAPQAVKHQGTLEPHELPAEQLNDALNIQLDLQRVPPVYRVRNPDGELLINAIDGSVITFDSSHAEQVAREDFSGSGSIVSVKSGTAPDLETRDSMGPYWQVNFSDSAETSIYVSVSNGEILERRNNYWRTFDVFWMLHIMDYNGREDINTPLIIIVSLVSIWIGISGFILLFTSFRRRDFNFLRKNQRS